VGGDRFTDSLRSLAQGGRLLVIGFTGGDIPTIKVNRLLLNNVDAVGVGWGAWTLTHPGYLSEQWAELEAAAGGGQGVGARADRLSTRTRRRRDRLTGGSNGQGEGRRQTAMSASAKSRQTAMSASAKSRQTMSASAKSRQTDER